MNFLTSVPVSVWISNNAIEIKINIEIFFGKIVGLIGFDIANIENRIITELGKITARNVMQQIITEL